MANNILAGISFPYRLQGGGIPAAATGTEVVRSALIVLLRTPKRSRVMRPTLGNSFQRIIFETQGPPMRALIQRELLTSIANFLPQVVVTGLDFKEDDHKIQVNVKYLIQGVQDQTGPVTIGQKG